MDGKCAAAIVHCANKNKKIEFYEINYGMDFPWSKIDNQDVVMVDFTLQPYAEMENLQKRSKSLIWIDHHKSAIETVEELGLDIPGLQIMNGGAGCELAWEYYFPGEPIPKAIQYLGDYDTWKFAFGEKTKQFQSGIQLQDTRPTSKLWYFLFDDIAAKESMISIIKDGDTINMYKNSFNKKACNQLAFEVELEGLKGIGCNIYSGSTVFDSIPNLYEVYDFASTFTYNGKTWTVSLYTERKDLDVSEIAKKYGGGGHKGAAGFQCEELPFKNRRKYESQNRD